MLVKLTASVKLETSEGTFAALLDTLQEANRCANWLSEQAWNMKALAQFKLHKLLTRRLVSGSQASVPK